MRVMLLNGGRGGDPGIRTPMAQQPSSPVTATPARINALTESPGTVFAGADIVIKIRYSGGSPQDQFGTVITDTNDDFDPFSCSETLVSGTATRGTEQQTCAVPSSAYVGNYSAQGVIFNPGPPPSTMFSGPMVSFAVVAPPAIEITTEALPDAVLWSRSSHSRYSAPLAASGGNAPYKWSLAVGSGPLPPGLKLHHLAGVISGKPMATGSYRFTLQVTGSRSEARPPTKGVATRTLSITVNP